jgi:hypothetical protein
MEVAGIEQRKKEKRNVSSVLNRDLDAIPVQNVNSLAIDDLTAGAVVLLLEVEIMPTLQVSKAEIAAAPSVVSVADGGSLANQDLPACICHRPVFDAAQR